MKLSKDQDMSQIYLMTYVHLSHKRVSRSRPNLRHLLKLILTLRHRNSCLILNKLYNKRVDCESVLLKIGETDMYTASFLVCSI